MKKKLPNPRIHLDIVRAALDAKTAGTALFQVSEGGECSIDAAEYLQMLGSSQPCFNRFSLEEINAEIERVLQIVASAPEPDGVDIAAKWGEDALRWAGISNGVLRCFAETERQLQAGAKSLEAQGLPPFPDQDLYKGAGDAWRQRAKQVRVGLSLVR